ncbi:MAG: tetratricopeptide repeat protein [Candidatus Promineifilaceae bacterium]|nr:tetratricopeptide repeat protein [Candidatus Promineifilaceae bacterium]
MLEFRAGDWNEAQTALRESVELYGSLGAAAGEALAKQQLGVLQSARGELDEAMASFEEGVTIAERAAMRAHCLARLYASMTRNRLLAGDLEAAAYYLDRGLAMGERHGNCATCDSLLLPVAVSVRARQGNLEEAERFCRQLEREADEYASQTWMAMACQTRGEVAAAQGNVDRALECYREACEAFSEANNVYETARCKAAIARLLAMDNEPGKTPTTASARNEAREIFERLGADAELHIGMALSIPQRG